jgi:hypothetical protein
LDEFGPIEVDESVLVADERQDERVVRGARLSSAALIIS